MSYLVRSAPSGLGLALEASGNMRLGLTREAPCPASPPYPAAGPVPMAGLGAGIAFPGISLPPDMVAQVVAGLTGPLNTAVDAAVDRGMARLPTTPAYASARNGVLMLLGVQLVVILGGMFLIEKDFGRK